MNDYDEDFYNGGWERPPINMDYYHRKRTDAPVRECGPNNGQNNEDVSIASTIEAYSFRGCSGDVYTAASTLVSLKGGRC
jgi:hypothetical protein